MYGKPSLRVKRSGPPNDSGGEPRQVLDVGGHRLGEKLHQDGVGERLGVEQLREAVQRLVSPCVLVERPSHRCSLSSFASCTSP